MLIPSDKTAAEAPEGTLASARAPRPDASTPLAATRAAQPRLLVVALIAVAALVAPACSCPWSPPPADDQHAMATLTWTGDADLDLELYRVNPGQPDSAPLAALRAERIEAGVRESVEGREGERILFDPPRHEGRYLLAVRFWSVGASNSRRTNATVTLTDPGTPNRTPAVTFTAILDDDSADLWFPAIVDRDARRVIPRGDTLAEGL